MDGTELTVYTELLRLVNLPGFINGLAGIGGGFVSLYAQRETIRQGFGRIVVGGLCGHYLYSIAVPIVALVGSIVQVENLDTESGVAGFLMGAVGLIFIQGFMNTLSNYFHKFDKASKKGDETK